MSFSNQIDQSPQRQEEISKQTKDADPFTQATTGGAKEPLRENRIGSSVLDDLSNGKSNPYQAVADRMDSGLLASPFHTTSDPGHWMAAQILARQVAEAELTTEQRAQLEFDRRGYQPEYRKYEERDYNREFSPHNPRPAQTLLEQQVQNRADEIVAQQRAAEEKKNAA